MTGAGSRQFGIVQIGASALGIPIEHFSEVFHIHKEEALPQRSDYLRGGIELRGRLVPVLDLPKMGGLKDSKGVPRFGVILEHDQRLLAFFADEIAGITTVPEDDIHGITNGQTSDGSLFQDLFSQDGRFVSILNVARIFAAPEVFTVQRPDITRRAVSRTQEPMLTFEAGGALYSAPAVEVYAAIPKQIIEKTAITMGPCLGEISYHGRRIPVVCPVQTLGLGERTTTTVTEVVALRFPNELVLGFAVDAIHEIGTFPEGKVTTLPLWQADRNFIDRVVIRNEDEQLYAISLDNLHAAQDLRDIASLSAREEEPEAEIAPQISDTRNMSHQKERYLVVDAADRLAIPLSQVNCILERPTRLTSTHVKLPGFQGYFSRFDESIALFDLAECMGRHPGDHASAKVLLTGVPGHQSGFLVQNVVGIEISEWCEIPQEDSHNISAPLVQLGEGPAAVVLPACDLTKVAGAGITEPA